MASTSTTSTTIPSYVQDPTKDALKSIQDWLGSDQNYVYGAKKGETLYTPLSGMQLDAIGNAGWLADQDLAEMFGINDAESFWRDFADDKAGTVSGSFGGSLVSKGGYGKAQSIDTERLVDENGWLGAISDYMNPYTDQVLRPQIREIDEAIQRQRRDLGASSAMSGSFGDARHGVMESEMYRGANEAVSDATGRAYSDAFDRAMSARSGDLSRKMGVDTYNADSATRALERLLGIDFANQQAQEAGKARELARRQFNAGAKQTATANKAAAAQGLAGLGSQFFNLFTDVNDTLFNAGEVTRGAEQEKAEAARAFQEAMKNKKYDDALKLLGAATGSPAPTTSTTTKESNDGLWGLVGALLSGGAAALA